MTDTLSKIENAKQAKALVADLTNLPDAIAEAHTRLLSQSGQVELLKEQIKTEQVLAQSAAEGSNAQKRQAVADLMLEDNEGYQDMRRELLFMREGVDSAAVEYERLKNKFSATKLIASIIAGKDNG